MSLWMQDRQRLEQLCRYVLRPAVAQDRLRLSEDGRVVLELKATWSDGTSHLVFDPLDLLVRLAALVPRPRVNLILYHGVLAPHARLRDAVVSYGAVSVVEPPPAATVATASDAAGASSTASLPLASKKSRTPLTRTRIYEPNPDVVPEDLRRSAILSMRGLASVR
jgi:hypothetical protein